MRSILRTLRLGLCLAGLLTPLAGLAEDSILPQPVRYFNDYAGEINRAVARLLNERLERHAATCPIVVVVFSHMESDSDIAEYTRRVAQSWGIDQKGQDNRAFLFVFTKDRKGYIQVGAGLKNKISASMAQRIIEEQLLPRLNSRDYPGALSATIEAVLAAAKPQPKTKVSTVGETPTSSWGTRKRRAVIPESAANVILIIAAIPVLIGGALWIWTGGWRKSYGPKDTDRLLRDVDRLLLVHKILFWEITSSRKRKRKGDGPPSRRGADEDW